MAQRQWRQNGSREDVMSKQDSVVIVSGVRTPMGGFQGSLSAMTAPELGSIVIKAAVERAAIKPEDVQEVVMGCVLPAGLKRKRNNTVT